MERELIQFGESQQTMSSLEIAKLTGKPHNDVLKAIRAMEPAWEKVQGGKFSLSSKIYDLPNGGHKEQPYYELTKTECLYVATKFNDEARAKLVIRWEELEKKSREGMIALPNFTDPAEAAMAWAKEYREKKVLAIENDSLKIENKILEKENIELASEVQELKHDRNYLDIIMRSRSLMTVSQIAQDYGMSAKAFNQQLAQMGIQYKNNEQWILYSRYKDCGYVSSRTIDITRSNGMPDVVMHTEWTQAGRRFLYEELKKRGIIPMLERD
jgi:phage antirepressor YoqD-like protein